MNKSTSLTSRYNLDFGLILATLALVIMGILFIYSAGSHSKVDTYHQHYFKQILFLVPGALLFGFFLFFNYQKLSVYWFVFYATSLFLLIYVILPFKPPLIFPKEINNAKSWISINDWFSFQPSEMSKLLIIFVLARFIDKSTKNIQNFSTLITSLALPLPILALIMIQPDPGTALVYIPITLVMLILGGARISHVLAILFVGVISLIFTLYPLYDIKSSQELLKENQANKISQLNVFYSMAFTKKDIRELNKSKMASLNVLQSKRGKLEARNKDLLKQKTEKMKNVIAFFTLKIAALCFGAVVLMFLSYKLFKVRVFFYSTIVSLVLAIGISSAVLGQMYLKPYHVARLTTVINLEANRHGAGYNQWQSIVAIGSGWIFGHGLGEGPQTTLNYVPEIETDFIFAVIGEEWGFLGSLLVLFLYGVLIYRGLMIAYQSKDYFGTLLAAGITAMFFSHVFVNLGMSVGILPVMGIPLPFLSAGGSSLMTNLIAVALLLNISQRRYVH